MNIIIAGCGKIGETILASLTNEGHDVTVIDRDAEKLNEIINIYDIIGVLGNGADSEVLEEASANKAELFIAFTENREDV